MQLNLSEKFKDALHYWEPRRIVYNAVLAIWTVLLTFNDLVEAMGDTARQTLGLIVVIAIFAAIANILYSTAYVVDIAAQLSPFQDVWRRRRGILFTAGTVLACICVVMIFFWSGENM